MSMYYMLDDDDQPVPVADVIAWGQWYETADRRVASTTIGPSRISTVFLGLDHSFTSGPPVLYETLVFGGRLDGEMRRYETRAKAELGHQAIVRRVRRAEEKA